MFFFIYLLIHLCLSRFKCSSTGWVQQWMKTVTVPMGTVFQNASEKKILVVSPLRHREEGIFELFFFFFFFFFFLSCFCPFYLFIVLYPFGRLLLWSVLFFNGLSTFSSVHLIFSQHVIILSQGMLSLIYFLTRSMISLMLSQPSFNLCAVHGYAFLFFFSILMPHASHMSMLPFYTQLIWFPHP